MKNFARRAMCLVLVALILTVAFVSCDKGGDDDRVSATGEIGADAVKNPNLTIWTGDGKKSDSVDRLLSDNDTYDLLKTELAKGGRIKNWSIGLKNLKDFEGKKLTKVSFTLEADRAVTLTVSVSYSTYTDCIKTITLEANKTQAVELELNEYIFKTDTAVFIHFWRIAEGEKAAEHYVYNTDELGEWSQTVYKVTDFKLFCA